MESQEKMEDGSAGIISAGPCLCVVAVNDPACILRMVFDFAAEGWLMHPPADSPQKLRRMFTVSRLTVAAEVGMIFIESKSSRELHNC